MGKGVPIGYFSSSLKELQGTVDDLAGNIFKWLELSPADSTNTTQVDMSKTTRGRIKCAVFLSPQSRVANTGKGFIGEQNSGYIQIIPTRDGPWTTVRLNYVAHATCSPLGNVVVASEVIVEDGNRYVNIRSLVSVSNNTDFVLELCLQLVATNENMDAIDDGTKDFPTNEIKTEHVQKQVFIGELKPGERAIRQVRFSRNLCRCQVFHKNYSSGTGKKREDKVTVGTEYVVLPVKIFG